MPIQVTEDLLRAVTTKEKALSDGRTLAKKGVYQRLSRTDDMSLLWGECQGSGAKPYLLSIDLGGDNPTIRCTCPVKPPPCKHTLGLLVMALEKPAAFQVAEPPADLLEKRQKNQERAEKRAEAATRPREVNRGALEKKVQAQRDGLDLLEQLVLDTIAGGLGTLDRKRAARLLEQARQLNDAYLPGAAETLRRIATLAAAERGDADVYYRLREPGDALPHDDRHRLLLRHLTRLWATVRKGKQILDERPVEGEPQSDADALVEGLLGRVWQLVDLKERGYLRRDLTLLELAYERYDDRVREERVEQSFLLDLGGGEVLCERSFRPLAALNKTKEKESYERPLLLGEVAVYPGFVNRRVRWDLAAVRSRRIELPDFERVHAAALPAVDVALARFKEQVKNPLAPDEAVLLLRARSLMKAGPALVLGDDKGGRLTLLDSPLARCHTCGNLEMAAGAVTDGTGLAQPASLLVRLWLGLADGAVRGQPLALVVGSRHVRLGM